MSTYEYKYMSLGQTQTHTCVCKCVRFSMHACVCACAFVIVIACRCLHARYVVIGGMHCLLCFRAFLPIEVTCECVDAAYRRLFTNTCRRVYVCGCISMYIHTNKTTSLHISSMVYLRVRACRHKRSHPSRTSVMKSCSQGYAHVASLKHTYKHTRVQNIDDGTY